MDMGYSYTGHGAQGGADGGGYIPGESQTSPDAKKVSAEPSIRPVTIKQIFGAEAMTSEAAEFKIDGAVINTITIVAQLQNTKVSTNIHYKLDDGTGVIEGKRFINDTLRQEIESGMKPEIPYNTYVRVYGRLRELGNTRSLTVDSIQPLHDMNEISYHMLEATLVHLQSKGAPTTANGGGDEMDTAMYGGNEDDKLRGVSDDAKRFYRFLANAGQDTEGLNLSDIARELKMDLNRCTECSRQLSAMGLIYSTKDEDTWAVLDTGGYY